MGYKYPHNWKKSALAYLNKLSKILGPPTQEVTDTRLWETWMLKYPGIMFANPPLRPTEVQSESRALIIGVDDKELGKISDFIRNIRQSRPKTARDLYSLAQENLEFIQGYDICATSLLLYDTQRVYSSIGYTSETNEFWRHFFGKKDFLENKKELTKPTRILTTGWQRYTSTREEINLKIYSTYFLTTNKRIKEVSSEWGIPAYSLRRRGHVGAPSLPSIGEKKEMAEDYWNHPLSSINQNTLNRFILNKIS